MCFGDALRDQQQRKVILPSIFLPVLSFFVLQALPSISPIPPPSPMHRRSPVPLSPAPEDGEETVAETADSSVVIRMTPRHKGEELLTVEMKAGEGEVEEEAEEKEETKEKEEEPSKE